MRGKPTFAATVGGPVIQVIRKDEERGRVDLGEAIPGTGLGTRLHDVVTNGNDVFVTLDDELVIISANGGRIRGRLGSF